MTLLGLRDWSVGDAWLGCACHDARMGWLRGYLLCCTSIVSCGPEVVDRDSIELAFTRSSETNDTERVLGVAAGGRVVELFTGGSGDLLHSLQWSSDGEFFAFTRNRGGSFDVVALSLASGEALEVPGILVRWMPARRELICRRDNHDLVLVDLATGSERVLDVPDGSGLASAPDGDRWAYVSEDAIHIVDLQTGSSSRLVVRSDDGVPLRPEDLAWSPDGERIAFVADDPDGVQHSRLFTVDVESGDVAIWRDETSYGVESPTWSPDGTRLGASAWGFDAIYPTDYRVIVYDVATMTQVEAVSAARAVTWSDDGRRATVGWREEAGSADRSTTRVVVADNDEEWISAGANPSIADADPAWRPRDL
jgi:Tol biopolymer transport system component